MNPRAPKRRADHGEDAWLITYADLITQLMCFFVIIAMISQPEMGKFKDVTKAFASGFTPDVVETPYAAFYRKTESWIEAEGIAVNAAVDYSNRGVTIDLAGDAMFGAGSAQPTPGTARHIKDFASMLLAQPDLSMKRTRLVVEGYSDDAPTTGTPFASPWELSAARAAAIARLLAESGIPAGKIQLTAYGATRPLVPNRDAADKPIPDNQARNRRVVVRVERGD